MLNWLWNWCLFIHCLKDNKRFRPKLKVEKFSFCWVQRSYSSGVCGSLDRSSHLSLSALLGLWGHPYMTSPHWMIKLTKTPILPNCQVPNGFFLYNSKLYHPRSDVLQNWNVNICLSFSGEGKIKPHMYSEQKSSLKIKPIGLPQIR